MASSLALIATKSFGPTRATTDSQLRSFDSKAAVDCRRVALATDISEVRQFWTAPVLWRFGLGVAGRIAEQRVPTPITSPCSCSGKAAEDCRTPRRCASGRRLFARLLSRATQASKRPVTSTTSLHQLCSQACAARNGYQRGDGQPPTRLSSVRDRVGLPPSAPSEPRVAARPPLESPGRYSRHPQ